MFGMHPIPFHDLFMIMLLILAGSMLWKWHKSDNDFDLQQLIVDNSSGKLSIEKTGYMVAIVVVSWGMVGLFSSGKITENYMGIYLTALVISRGVSSGLSVLKDVKMGPPDPTKGQP